VSWRFEMLKKYSYLFEDNLLVFPPEINKNQNNNFSQSSNCFVAQTSTESFFGMK
jgi:hypothetical protein